MRSIPLAVLLLALASAALAGCAADEAALPPAEPAPAGGERPPEPQVEARPFGWLAATGTPVTDIQFLSTNAAVRDVGGGATSLAADIAWTCSSPACELHAWLCAPGEEPAPLAGCAIHAVGASPLSLSAEAPAPGDWLLRVASSGPSADVAGTITFTES